MEVDMMADNGRQKININMEIQFGERVGHGGWLIWPNFFDPTLYPACTSSKLCEFILQSVHLRMWAVQCALCSF